MEKFDPYRKWLAIPARDQPPNHYRLLGLDLFEEDLDVIEAAADQKMAFVRQYQSGENAAHASRILNELATARLCLLKSDSKKRYDAELRGRGEFAFSTLNENLSLPAVSNRNTSQRRSSSSKMLWMFVSAGAFAIVVITLFVSQRIRVNHSVSGREPPPNDSETVATNHRLPPTTDSHQKNPVATTSATNSTAE